MGNQWPTDIRADRQLAGRPCLTVNVLPQFIRQVTNEQRQQRPGIVINPVGNGATQDVADVLQGYCRHVEVLSDAEIAYDIGFDCMVRGGFGFWRLNTRYVSDTGDEQEIFVEPIKNCFSVFSDPTSVLPDHSDEHWKFIVEDIPESEYKRLYPESKIAMGLAGLDEYVAVGNAPAHWASRSGPLPTIRVAEYFYDEYDGRKREIHWAKISALDILDEKETIWCGIPVIGVYGDDITVNGKRHIAGLVRFAKDPQRQKNYWTSAATEMIALAPKAPFMLTKKQMGQYTAMYEQSNYRNMAYLLYEKDNEGGSLAPPPARNTAEPPIQAMNQMLALCNTDIQSTTGLYSANLGKQESAQESGRAVMARQKQGDINTLNFSDNLARAIRQTGKLIVKAMPKIKTAPQIQRIINPDNSVKMVGIYNGENDTPEEAMDAFREEEGIKEAFDINAGTYDVTVTVGPSYQTKRQEAVATQLELLQTDPNLWPVIGDLVVGNMDIPQAREMAKRMKIMLPPQLQEDPNGPGAQIPQLQAQLQQFSQQHQLLMQQLQQAQQIIQTKQVEQQGKMQIETMHTQAQMASANLDRETKLAIAEIQTNHQQVLERARLFTDLWKEMHKAGHDVALSTIEAEHEKFMQQSQAAHDLAAQESQQAAQQNQQPQPQQAGG